MVNSRYFAATPASGMATLPVTPLRLLQNDSAENPHKKSTKPRPSHLRVVNTQRDQEGKNDVPFTCPYSGCAPHAPCEVSSCSFNLANKPVATIYNRCFLFYLEALRVNPTGQKKSTTFDVDFTKIPRHQREEIASFLLDVTEREVMQSYAEFYTSMFSLIAQDLLVSLRKRQLDPIPYKQCIVCGRSDEPLWYPQSGSLPDGYGYCSYACYQLKSPPLLNLERMLEIDYRELAEKLEFDLLKSRPKFVLNLIHWVFGRTPMT
jgi:hypothetical protein